MDGAKYLSVGFLLWIMGMDEASNEQIRGKCLDGKEIVVMFLQIGLMDLAYNGNITWSSCAKSC